MRIISFASTTPALLAGHKTVTRRDWSEPYARGFFKGERVQAWDRVPRVKGARKVAIIELTADPTYEPLADMPDSDYEAEGFAYLDAADAALANMLNISDVGWEGFDAWRNSGGSMWVIRFKLIEVCQ